MENQSFKKAIFAGGCFWCTEAIFTSLIGIVDAEPGYIGGTTENPTYEEVCTGTTGHAEVIRITYNPNEISFSALLEVFFATHDPTSLNRQGEDVGTQYRSEIFYLDEEQKRDAEEYLEILKRENVYEKPIVTALSQAGTFYKAEEYHKNYFEQNGNQPYCQVVVKPKIEKFKKEFSYRLK